MKESILEGLEDYSRAMAAVSGVISGVRLTKFSSNRVDERMNGQRFQQCILLVPFSSFL